MKRNRLPSVLVDWLDSRDFLFYESDKGKPGYLSEDEIYSAACELKYDMETEAEEYTPAEYSTIERFVKREGKTHRRIDLSEWYK